MRAWIEVFGWKDESEQGFERLALIQKAGKIVEDLLRFAGRRNLFGCDDTDVVLRFYRHEFLYVFGRRDDVRVHEQELLAAGPGDANIATMTETAVVGVGDKAGAGKTRGEQVEISRIRLVVDDNDFPVIGKIVGQSLTNRKFGALWAYLCDEKTPKMA